MSDHSHDSSSSFSGHETSHANDSSFSQSQPDSLNHSSHGSHSHSSSIHSAHTSHSADPSSAYDHGNEAHNGHRRQDAQHAQDSAHAHAQHDAQHAAHANHPRDVEQAELLRNAGVAAAFLNQQHHPRRFHGDGDLSPDFADDSPRARYARLIRRGRRVKQGAQRADSIFSVLLGIGAVAFGIFWTFSAINLTRAFHSSFIAVIFPVFGGVFTIIAMARVMKSIVRLTGEDGPSGDGSNRSRRD